MKRSLSLLLLAVVSLGLFLGCEVGLGKSIDLEGPVITITSPLPQSNVRKNVTLEGTCTDNVRVTQVLVTNKITGESYGNAEINGETWKIQLNLEEGEVELVCQAKDANNNQSTKSVRTILLLVDETAPEGLSWYIERGKGIQVPLQSKEALEALNLEDVTNKYVPQNEKFTIHGNFYDAMSIDTITLTLTEKGKGSISKTIDADSASPNYIGDGKSIFAPAFEFTHDELKAALSSWDSGMHYLEVSYYSQDEHKNGAERTLPYLLWYPESDEPGIMQAATVNNNLAVNVGSSIFLHFFDDDELTELAWDFITEADLTANGITDDNIPAKKDTFTNKQNSAELNGTSDFPTQVSAGETTGLFYLLAYAKDVNGKEKVKKIKTVVADKTYPMLIIENPGENSVPSVNANNITFNGYSYDTAGSKNVKIVYIPSDGSYDTPTKREDRAKEIFEGSPAANGEIYKSYTFPVSKTKDPNDKWYIEAFSFDFSVLGFGEENNKSKFFELALEDTDGNIVYKQYNLSGDSKSPSIDIKSPSDNMIVCDYRNNDLLLKFKATKDSGLGFKQTEYKIERKGFESSIYWTFTESDKDGEGYYSVTIPRATLKNWAEGTGGFSSDTQPIFVFYAEDVLGNKAHEERTVVLSPLPVLEKVMADTITGTYPAGKTITLQAKFSDSVRVTGSPRLVLGGIKDKDGNTPSTTYYANYSSGSLSDTLSFTFEVPEDVQTAESGKLICTGAGIDLNGGTIVTNVEGTGNAGISFVSGANFWEDSAPSDVIKTIELDGLAPDVISVTPVITGVTKNSDGKWYVNANKDVRIQVKFTEPVLVSGNPKIIAGGKEFAFQSMQGDTVTFIHTVASGENATVQIAASSFTAVVKESIKDSAGNQMKASTITADTIVFDTQAPATPSVTGVVNGVYNSHPTITVTATNTEDKLEYSTNGGLSWSTYTSPYKILGTGNFIIEARATDKAGNISTPSTGIEITINDTFPLVNEISIAKTDGKYKQGTPIEFKVFLQDEVQPYTSTQALLTFTGISVGNTITKTVQAVASSQATNKIVFKYIVEEGVNFTGVRITGVDLGTIQDKYTNQASDATNSAITSLLAGESCNRTGIILDGEAPHIATYKLGASSAFTYGTDVDKVSSASNAAGSFTIELTFNEKVIKESGIIILQRKGKWAIPPVMNSTTFLKWYNKITNDNDKQKLIRKNADGSEVLDTMTGQPVGPYKKITHGLIESGTTLIPDIATKYVLDFNYGLYDDLSAEDNTVSEIRRVLSSVDYDKHTVEVRNVTVVNNKVTITFPELIEDGQNWELIIPDDSFHDETGNYFKGLKAEADAATGDYKLSLWSNTVAAPVVRVNRYSHGMGAYGLNASGSETLITGWTSPNATTYTASSGSNLKPLGYAQVRIDCETPGADIYYQTVNGDIALSDDYKWASKRGTERQQNGQYRITNVDDTSNIDDTHKSSIADIAKSSLVFSSGGTSYSTYLSIGDTTTDENRYKTARKDYVSAYATKTGFTISSNGYEGVFKTLIIAYKNNTNNQINIEGGTAEGGEPIVSGFPVRDATSDHRYAKNAYHFTEDFTYTVETQHVSQDFTESDANFFAWVSYDIVSDWAILQHRSNYSSNYPKHTYGQVIFLSNYSTWE